MSEAVAAGEPPAALDDALDAAGVAAILHCSDGHIRALVRRGEFPRPAKLGALRRWSRAVVLAWLEANTGKTDGVR